MLDLVKQNKDFLIQLCSKQNNKCLAAYIATSDLLNAEGVFRLNGRSDHMAALQVLFSDLLLFRNIHIKHRKRRRSN